MKKTITYEGLVKELLGVNKAADSIATAADKAGGAADAASNTFKAIGDKIDPVCANVTNALGSIQSAGDRVDKSLKILTPVVMVSAGLFGAAQASKLFKSLKGSKSTSEVEIEFDNRELADAFAGSIATHRELKPYCRVKSIQAQKVVLAVDTNYLEKNFNKFQAAVAKLKTTTAKRPVGESGIGAALALGAATAAGGMLVNPIVNKIQGKSGSNMQVNYQFKDNDSMNSFVDFVGRSEIVDASVKVASEDNVNKIVTLQGDEKKIKTVFPEIEKKATELGAIGGSGNGYSPAVNESTKITLTIKQLKKLIKESVDEDKTVRVTAVDWDISDTEYWDDDQPIEIDDEDDEEHWDDDQIDDDEMTDDEKNEIFKKLGLPTMDEVIEVQVRGDWTPESDDGEVADWLSDNYGFAVNGWTPADKLDEGWSDDPANDPEDGDWELNPDGTFKRDANGKKIPKSFRKDIKNFWNKLRGRA